MTELDKIRAEIEARLEAAQRHFDQAMAECGAARSELLAHDRAVAAMGVAAADGPPTRHWRSVQRPVMALFDRTPAWTAEGIIEETRLPESSVRKFLVRAAKAGLLACDHNGEYRLPAKPLSEAAE